MARRKDHKRRKVRARERVIERAEKVGFGVELLLRAALGAVEEHMLQEVGDAVDVRRFVAHSRIDNDVGDRHLHAAVGDHNDLKPIRKRRLVGRRDGMRQNSQGQKRNQQHRREAQ